MKEALEYTVAPDGRVSTNGFYRVVSELDWETLPHAHNRTGTRYDTAMQAIAQGTIIAIAASNHKAAWNVRRTLRANAQRRHLALELSTRRNPDVPGGFLVLARLAR